MFIKAVLNFGGGFQVLIKKKKSENVERTEHGFPHTEKCIPLSHLMYPFQLSNVFHKNGLIRCVIFMRQDTGKPEKLL